MKKLLIISILILILIVIGLGFWYYLNQHFSKEILQLEIFGPKTASAGSEITYTVNYKNNSNFSLKSAKVIFEIPDNSLTEDGRNRYEQNVKPIEPSGQGSVEFKIRLFGKEDDLKVIKAGLSYVPENLSARYESDSTFTTKIDSVPVELSFDVPSNLQQGSRFTYTINYLSHIDYPLENMSLKLDMVPGFVFESAIPTSLDNTEWKLKTFNKDQMGKVTITGTINTSVANLTFGVHLGMWQDGNFVVIKDVTSDVVIGGVIDTTLPDNSSNTPAPLPKPSSHIGISQKAYHNTHGVFEDSGPIPPEVSTSTTYTVTWQITNDLNNVQNVKVEAILPQNVSLAAIDPESQISSISLDGQTRRLVWMAGNVFAGAGMSIPSPTISFQLTLTPDQNQQGQLANIIGQAMILGQDQITGASISSISPGINTSLPDDQANSGGGIVQ